jgi:cyclohexanone monooxygenase
MGVPARGELADEGELERLRRRYRQERDKRTDPVRDTTLELLGELARYRDDPYTTPAQRLPVSAEADVVIVGAGLGGLLCAAKLRDIGISRIRLIDIAGDVGGVWYWNRYPGAMCDIESYIYLPLLEELGYIPRDKYSHAEEILFHTQAIAKHYDLYHDALFHTGVTRAEWNDAGGSWHITTDRHDAIRSQYLVLSLGSLSRPRFPAITGIESYRGEMFHTSRWNYEFTGGNADGNLTQLADKEVGIIGTGATAIQCVPHLGRWAERLYVIQRTPSSVSLRGNRPTDPAFAEALEPGWQMRRIENFSRIVEGGYEDVDLVDDGWTESYRNLLLDPSFAELSPEEATLVLELADIARMQRIRDRVDTAVRDQDTAEALKPYYAYLCKRPCFHDDYLETFNRHNVTLLDTQGRGVDYIYPDGVVVQGREYRLDALIFATGFESGDTSARKVGFPVVGCNARTMTEKWEHGIATLHGVMSSGFPNLFMFPALNSQSHGAVNWVHLLYDTSTQVAHVVEGVRRRRHRVFDVTPDAEADWVATIIARRPDNLTFLESCTPGRVNNEGHPGERNPQNSNYGGGFLGMLEVTTAWRSAGNLPGLATR